MRHGRSPQPTTIILNRTLIACTGGASAASGPSSTGGRNSTWISKLVLLQLFMLFQGPGLKKNRRNSTRNSNLLTHTHKSEYLAHSTTRDAVSIHVSTGVPSPGKAVLAMGR